MKVVAKLLGVVAMASGGGGRSQLGLLSTGLQSGLRATGYDCCSAIPPGYSQYFSGFRGISTQELG